MSGNKKTDDAILKSLHNIEADFDTLFNFLKWRLPQLTVGEEEKKILQLCDRKHTIEEIAKETGKSENNVNFMLSDLRDKAFIRSVRIDSKVVYEKI